MIVHGFCSGFSSLSLHDDDSDDDNDDDDDDDNDDDNDGDDDDDDDDGDDVDDDVQYVNKGCKHLPSNVFADRSGS